MPKFLVYYKGTILGSYEADNQQDAALAAIDDHPHIDDDPAAAADVRVTEVAKEE